jgi:hypothetical protein
MVTKKDGLGISPSGGKIYRYSSSVSKSRIILYLDVTVITIFIV